MFLIFNGSFEAFLKTCFPCVCVCVCVVSEQLAGKSRCRDGEMETALGLLKYGMKPLSF